MAMGKALNERAAGVRAFVGARNFHGKRDCGIIIPHKKNT